MEIQIPPTDQSGNTSKKKQANLSQGSISKRIAFLIFVIIKVAYDHVRK